MSNMRRLLSLVLLSFFVAGYLPTNGMQLVTDDAHILNAHDAERLTQELTGFAERSGVIIHYVSVSSLEGSDVAAYGPALFRNWAQDYPSDVRRVVLLHAPRERKIRIDMSTNLVPRFANYHSTELLQEWVKPHLAEGDVLLGIMAGVRAIERQVAPRAVRPINSALSGVDERPLDPQLKMSLLLMVPLSILVLGGALYFFLIRPWRINRKFGRQVAVGRSSSVFDGVIGVAADMDPDVVGDVGQATYDIGAVVEVGVREYVAHHSPVDHSHDPPSPPADNGYSGNVGGDNSGGGDTGY